jgi:hypothetical protein
MHPKTPSYNTNFEVKVQGIYWAVLYGFVEAVLLFSGTEIEE